MPPTVPPLHHAIQAWADGLGSLAAAVVPTLADAALEDLRTAIPALRALPLLRKLALGEGGVICLDYLPPMQLGVAIQPC